MLFWGIMGALLMRGILIGAGAALINQFHWVLYLMGGFLVFTGIKMLFVDDDGVHPERTSPSSSPASSSRSHIRSMVSIS